ICDFIRTISKDNNDRILVLITGRAWLGNGNPWQILRAGASDVLLWDQNSDIASVMTAKFQRWQEIDELVNSALIRNSLVGNSRAWKSVLCQLIEIARFTDDPVVLIGETGTGKELAARLIHTLDLKRNNRDLVVLDCTTIVPDLSGSELFGHEKGSFTGAVSSRDGAFALADGGTLFLDEVGELTLSLQVQLLRVLQEHTYKRVGSNLWHKADFRLICATNRELRNNLEIDQFRKDLYYRIAHWVVRMPPLRERIEDIIPLVQYFMKQARPDEEPPELDDKVQEYFLTREYPGNVRDLRSLVFRIIARHLGSGPITIGDIPSDERPSEAIDQFVQHELSIEQSIRRAVASGLGLKEIKRLVEDTTIRVVLEDQAGNLQRAARVLDVTDRTLQKRRADQLRDLEAIVNR
ncbi:MAG TPA: sigma 54-interacting transcriptional regulator, partial [Anaerolineales bacterium]|nr:sigma 54-interacting transcriptional regulator [Anaerolineales bacterium]